MLNNHKGPPRSENNEFNKFISGEEIKKDRHEAKSKILEAEKNFEAEKKFRRQTKTFRNTCFRLIELYNELNTNSRCSEF